MANLSYSIYSEGLDELHEVVSTKKAARFWADMYSPSWHNNQEAFAALELVANTARELEKALRSMLAVYERQEMADNPEDWEFADKRRRSA